MLYYYNKVYIERYSKISCIADFIIYYDLLYISFSLTKIQLLIIDSNVFY